MEKFTTVTSHVVPLPIRDVDTDMIIPAEFLTSVSRDGYGENVFKRLREADPHFPLNQPRYAGAKIMVADDNFGCGSSREHAVWALTGWGLHVIISTSFADIFAGNSAKNGLLLITLAPEIVGELLQDAKAQAISLTVDLSKQTVTRTDGRTYPFEYDPFRKYCLLEGLDDLDYMLARLDTIEAYRARRAEDFFFSMEKPNHNV